MARRLRFNGTGSGGTGCPSLHGFWSFDGRLVITEDWHAELWLDDADTIATYQRVWQSLSGSALFGAEVQHVIARARRSLDLR